MRGEHAAPAGTEVLVLGRGPAGIGAACALHRLGHAVAVLGMPGEAGAIEGVSERTRALLAAAGLQSAAAVAGAPVTRSGTWAGHAAAAGPECILDRARFDAALAAELASRGIRLHGGRVLGIRPQAGGWRVSASAGRSFEAALVVDARGRRAQRSGSRGPALVALSQAFSGELRAPGTCIVPSAEGWFWLAHTDGRTWVQYVTRPSRVRAAGRNLRALLECAIAGAPRLAAALAGAAAAGGITVRSATARLASAAPAPCWLRAGDAAVASDPLSGHGIHEALRSARVISACAHTALSQSGAGETRAAVFARDWSEALWRQSLRMASGFYAAEAASQGGAFWDETASEYAAALARAESAVSRASEAIRIEQRPVLAGDLIELRPVVVTAHHPRGIWQIDAVDILALREVLRDHPRAALEGIARRFARPVAAIDSAAAWLIRHGMLAESERPVA